jgi:signal transduction histidine kinase
VSLAAKVGVGFLALVAVMLVVGTYQLTVIARLEADNRHLAGISLEAGSLSLELRGELARLRELTAKLKVLRDPGYAAGLADARTGVRDRIARLRRLRLAPGERVALERFAVLWARYERRAPLIEAELLERGAVESADAALQSLEAMQASLRELVAASERNMRSIAQGSTRRAERARWVSAGAWLVGVLAAVVGSALLVRSVLAPLRALQRGAHALGTGDLSHRVPESGPPELAALAAEFNAMADRLEELDRLKKDFVSTVSHELKAPLASMQETLGLLLDGSLGPLTADQEYVLGLNRECADRLGGMIRDLLDLARLEAGAVEYQFEEHDLVAVARTVLAELEPSLGRKRLRLETRFPAAPVHVEADAVFLRQVLRNLLSNAVKFNPEGGEIVLAIRRWGDRAELPPGLARRAGAISGPLAGLSVADRGPGIPDEHKGRVFDRFHRVDAKTKGSQGTGLGLSIARNVVAGHRGAIWVEDRPGGGSVFVVLLRAVAAVGDRREAEVELPARA